MTPRAILITLAVVAIAGGLLMYIFQDRVERGEDECRASCAASGGYRYSPPGKMRAEACTCVKDR